MKSAKTLFLTLGIGLPFLLVGILWIAVQLKQNQIAAPKYNFIYVVKNYGSIKITIKNNALYLTGAHMSSPKLVLPKIFFYNVTHHTATEINYQKPKLDLKNNQTEQSIKIFSFKHYNISKSITSPDGYHYEYGASHQPLLLFNRYDYKIRLIKDAKKVELVTPREHRSIKILGWLIPENHND